MWFIAHTATPGCEHVISIDFVRCIALIPEQDTTLEPEFELLEMPTSLDLASEYRPPPPSRVSEEIDKSAIHLQITTDELLDMTSPSLSMPPPPPSPLLLSSPVSPNSCRSVSPMGMPPRADTPTPGKVKRIRNGITKGRGSRKVHTALTDEIMLLFVQEHGTKWRELARAMGGRRKGWSDDVCRNRWLRMMEEQEGSSFVRPKRGADFKKPAQPSRSWTDEEDAQLAVVMTDIMREPDGKRYYPWKDIAIHFGSHRTPHAIRNRASRLGLRGDIV